MNTILVWVLVMNSSAGGIVVYDNIASWDDCERLRIRSSQATNRRDDYSYVAGACTQINKVVLTQPAPTINVAPSPAPSVTVQNRVIIRKPQTP